MRITGLVTLLFVIALAGTSHAQVAPPTPALSSVELSPELDRVLRDYEDAWRRGDAAGLAALFAEDGFVLQGGRAPQRGAGPGHGMSRSRGRVRARSGDAMSQPGAGRGCAIR